MIPGAHMTSAAVFVASLFIATAAAAAGPEAKTAELLTKLMQSGRKVVAETHEQGATGTPGTRLTPDRFVSRVVADFARATSIDLRTSIDRRKASERDARLLLAMLDAQRETVIAAEQGGGAAPLAPGLFVRWAAETFTEKTGVVVRFTALESGGVRSRPDAFERRALLLIAQPTYPKGQPYREVVHAGGERIVRIMFPEYVTRTCRSCFGESRYRNGAREGKLAGALSVTFSTELN
jgi:hypothetical protein